MYNRSYGLLSNFEIRTSLTSLLQRNVILVILKKTLKITIKYVLKLQIELIFNIMVTDFPSRKSVKYFVSV